MVCRSKISVKACKVAAALHSTKCTLGLHIVYINNIKGVNEKQNPGDINVHCIVCTAELKFIFHSYKRAWR